MKHRPRYTLPWILGTVGSLLLLLPAYLLAIPFQPVERLRLVQGETQGHKRFALPMGLSIQAFTGHPQGGVFAGTFGQGIFFSQDKGRNWKRVNQGLADPFILSMATAKDGTVYAGTFRGGVFRSTNEGKRWEPFNDGLEVLQIKALLIHGKNIYAGTGDGVYQFKASGKQWMPVSKGFNNVLVHCLTMTPNGILYAGTSGKGILQFKSHAKGWTRLSRGLKDHEGLVENFIRVIAFDEDQILYAGTFDGGVFQSTNQGKSWYPISRALPNDSIRGIVSLQGGLFVATGRGVYMSANKGKAWVAKNEGLTERSIQVLFGNTEGTLYAGTSAGAFRSDDGGDEWVPINEGMAGSSYSPFGTPEGKE